MYKKKKVENQIPNRNAKFEVKLNTEPFPHLRKIYK